jgi:hypothetical protein
MFDSMVYDKIAATPQMVECLNHLSKEGVIVVLCTHIQEDELAKIPDEQKRDAITKIITKKVTTSGGVLDVSKWNQFTWGNGGSGGVRVDDVRSPSKKHTNDALIATTAAKDADVLVTDERRLSNRMKAIKAPCEIWGFDKFKEYIFQSLQF